MKSSRILGLIALALWASLAPAGVGAGESAEERLNKAELLAGLTAVEGPGVVVTLRHSPRKPPRNADRRGFQIHEQDVLAVLNALRAAGAEALGLGGRDSLVGERVLGTTALIQVSGGMTVAGIAMQAPYRILAIGDARVLRGQLMATGGVVKRAGLDTLQMIEIADAERIHLPAARSNGGFKFARVSDSSRVAPPVLVARAAPAPSIATGGTGGGASEQIGITRRPTSPDASPVPMPPLPVAPIVRPMPMPVEPTPRVTPTPTPTSTPAGATTKPDPIAVSPFFGGKGLAKFHAAGCRFGERIEAAQRVAFASRELAQTSGRMPCQICCPSTAPGG